MDRHTGTEWDICGSVADATVAWMQPQRPSDDAAGQQIQQTHSQVEAILDALPDATVVMGLDGRIQHANRRFLSDMRESQGRVLGKTPSDLGLLGCDRFVQLRSELVPRLISEGSLVYVETITRRLHGRSFVALLSLGLMRSAAGQPQAVVCSARDISLLKRIRREWHEYRRGLASIERFVPLGAVATLIRDMVQPLTVVRLANQTALAELEKLDCPDVIKQDLGSSIAASATIAVAVARFVEFAEQSKKPKEAEVRVSSVAKQTIRLLEHRARQANVAIRTENLETLPAVRMRENDLEQLFLALGQNAIQAADGKRNCFLLIAGATHDGVIDLRFQDNCGGIEPAHLPSLLDPFSASIPSGRRAGLGLYLARRIAELGGGRVSVQNRGGEGLTFTVTLPRE